MEHKNIKQTREYLSPEEQSLLDKLILQEGLQRVHSVDLLSLVKNNKPCMFVVERASGMRPEKVFYFLSSQKKEDISSRQPLFASIGLTIPNVGADLVPTESYEVYSIKKMTNRRKIFLSLQGNYCSDIEREIATLLEKVVSPFPYLKKIMHAKIEKLLYTSQDSIQEEDTLFCRVDPILEAHEKVPPMLRLIGTVKEIYVTTDPKGRDEEETRKKLFFPALRAYFSERRKAA